jgi:hypothetical protein
MCQNYYATFSSAYIVWTALGIQATMRITLLIPLLETAGATCGMQYSLKGDFGTNFKTLQS